MPDLDRRRLVYVSTLVVAVAWVVLDQATKVAAVRELEGVVPRDLGPLILRVIRNEGGAFSLPIRLPYLFVIVAIIVTVLVVRALPQTRSLGLATAYGMVVGGAIGNAADRIFRVDGAVVDMIDLDFAPLRDFPVFNVADIGITVGAALVAILMVREERRALAAQEVLEPLGAGAADPDAAAETGHDPHPEPDDDVDVDVDVDVAGDGDGDGDVDLDGAGDGDDDGAVDVDGAGIDAGDLDADLDADVPAEDLDGRGPSTRPAVGVPPPPTT